MNRSKWIGYGVKAAAAVLSVAGGMIISEKIGNKKEHEEAETVVQATQESIEVVTIAPESKENETTETSETEEN